MGEYVEIRIKIFNYFITQCTSIAVFFVRQDKYTHLINKRSISQTFMIVQSFSIVYVLNTVTSIVKVGTRFCRIIFIVEIELKS